MNSNNEIKLQEIEEDIKKFTEKRKLLKKKIKQERMEEEKNYIQELGKRADLYFSKQHEYCEAGFAERLNIAEHYFSERS